jgi:hypothetical protein
MKSSVRIRAPVRERRADVMFFTRGIHFFARAAIRPKIFLTGKFSNGVAFSEGKRVAKKFPRARGEIFLCARGAERGG